MSNAAHDRNEVKHFYFLFRALADLPLDTWVTRPELAMRAGMDASTIKKRSHYFVMMEPWINIKKKGNSLLYSKRPGKSQIRMLQEYTKHRITTTEAKAILAERRKARESARRRKALK